MKCPYRIKTIHTDNRGRIDGVNDRQEFCDCYWDECPLFVRDNKGGGSCGRSNAELKGENNGSMDSHI